MPSDQRPMAPYRRIATQIMEKIDRGELAPGDRVPSVNQIMQTEGVSTATATRVAAVLRAEGYAESVPGIGTIVTTRKAITAGAERLSRLRAGGTSVGNDETTQILDVQREEATQEVADALGLDVGAEVARRRRMYADAAGVVTVSATWIAGALADAAPEFLVAEPLPKMTFGLIEDRTGRRVAKRRDTVCIRPVPEDVAPHLGVSEGTDALVMVNHYWDQYGEPTEYAVDFLGIGRNLSAEYDLEEGP